MTRDFPLITIRHSENRSEVIKHVWQAAVEVDEVDWNDKIALEVWMPIYGLFSYERIAYDAGTVIECDGVVVHTFAATKRPKLGEAFQAYCDARDTYDKLTCPTVAAYRRKIGAKIEQMEEANPDFRQAYEDMKRDLPPL